MTSHYTPLFSESDAQRLAAASTNNNDLAQTEQSQDFSTLPNFMLEEKYGPEAVVERNRLDAARNEQLNVSRRGRSAGSVLGDTLLGITTGATNIVGGLASGVLAVTGKADDLLFDDTRALELSTQVADVTSKATDFMSSFQSDALNDRKALSSLEGELDAEDSRAQFERDIANQTPEFIAGLSQVGRDALNAGERVLSDGAVAGDILSQALGSLGPTAKAARQGVFFAENIAKVLTGATESKLAAAVGSSVGVGLTEASGTYSQTAQFVLSMSEDDLFSGSEEYRTLRDGGMEHDQAQRVVAGHTAQEAAARQLPAASVVGLLSARFNANPLTAFKGSSLIEGLRGVGSEALEEGFQGSLSTYNQNVAVQSQVDPEQSLIEGIGEEFAVGALAGAGLSGGIATPSVVAETAKTAAGVASDVAGSQTTSDILAAASQGASQAAEFVAPVTQAVVSTAQDLVDRPNKTIQSENIQAAETAATLAPDNVDIQNVTQILQNVAETKVSKMSDLDAVTAVASIQALQNSIDTLPDNVKTEVTKLLSSPDLARIQKRAARVNLNDTLESTPVTSETIQTSIQVAKTNPANVNAGHIEDILKQDTRTDITDEDIKLLTSAAKIATAVNNHRTQVVEISKEKSVALSKKPNYKGNPPSITDIEKTSQSIQVSGFKDATGKSLRSVNDFAADIFVGGQSENNTFTNKEGITVPVAAVVRQFDMFATHMRNKVEALNTSFAQNDTNGAGPTIQFESLVGGEKLVPAGAPGGAKGVFYHSNSPKSVEIAQTIENDAVITAEVYNTLVETFPDLFPEGKISVPKLIKSVPQDTLSDTEVQQEDTKVEDTPPVEEPFEINQDAPVSEETVTPEVTETSLVDENTAFEQAEQVKVEEELTPVDEAIVEPVKQPITQKFSDTFIPLDDDVSYTNGQEILDLITDENSDGYLDFAGQLLKPLIDGTNERLQTILTSKKDGTTIAEALAAGRDLTDIRDYKLTMLVDPTTGQYDPDLLSMAVVGVIDWLSSVRSADPSQLSDTLSDLGVTLGSLNDNEMENIMYGVSPRQATETVAKNIIRMWNVEVAKDSQLVDARGAVEGLVKEIITVLDQHPDFDILDINDVPVVKDGKKAITPTFNVKKLHSIQQEIGLEGQNSVQKVLAPEEGNVPSIGEKLTSTDQTQTRGNVKLSKLEKAALKAMQDTPHYLSAGLDNLVVSLDFDTISNMLGFRDVSDLADNHPLRASINGKNLSIERDWADAQMVVKAVNADDTTPVYYPVGISKVGRHQFKGINPQNNKILRALVTPTHSTLDMTNQEDIDSFWLTVAQSADLFKVENEEHTHILSNVQNEFQAVYGEAVALVEEFLTTGQMNKSAFSEAVGQIEMAQLSTIYAVASLNQTQDKTEFKTSMSFELDGKTDGPANMMSNFGQGSVTQDDYNNFQRVGFFLGSKLKTLNKYFSEGNVDLYNVTSSRSQNRMFKVISEASPSDKARMYAVQRFAAHFGDFKQNQDGSIEMTRNTSKNPMTKTVYGSGVKGVGEGIADDMVLGFYEAMTKDTLSPEIQYYLDTDLQSDFSMLFGINYPQGVNWKDSYLENSDTLVFGEFVTEFVGQILSDTAKDVIGAPISHVNNTLVFATGVQTEFLQALFKQKLAELVEKRASEGKINRNAKGEGVVRQLTQRDYDDLVKELRGYAPLYSNGAQTLAVGSFSGQISDNIELSSTLDGKLRMKSTLAAPDIAGVKVIPYISIGRGDAMMMNTIYGSDNSPTDTLPVFDGIDMPANKVKAYADQINQAVLQNWDRDVLGDVVTDFENFLGSIQPEDMALLTSSFASVQKSAKDTTVIAKDAEGLLDSLKEARRQNQARTQTFREISVSVDHMGGSDTAYTRGPDEEFSLDAINKIIADKLADKETDILDDPAPEVPTIIRTDSTALINALSKETRNKNVRTTVKVLKKLMKDPVAVIIGGVDKGMFNTKTKTIYLPSDNHETMAHELIHAATFEKVLDHYESGIDNPIVTRLETLMEQFMGLDLPEGNSAKAQILGYQTNTDPFNKAAALNEFMAWSLSNEALIGKLKSTNSVVTKITKTVKKLMQRLLGGVPTDMYSQILFNTEILVTGEGNGNGNDNNGGDDNSGGDITPPAHNFTNFWIDLVKERLQNLQETRGPTTIADTDQFSRYQEAAQNAVDKLALGGFNQSEYQKKTFRAIHMVLAMEMRLNTSSLIAINKQFDYITDNLTPDMFGEGRIGQERYSAVRELMGDTKNDEGVSDAIAVLLGLSQTSRGFRNALDKLPEPESDGGINTGSLNEFLTSVTGIMMSKAVQTVDTSGKSSKEILDVLAVNLLREESENEYTLIKGLMDKIDQADETVKNGLSMLAERAVSLNDMVKGSDRSDAVKAVTQAMAFAGSFLDSDRAVIAADAVKKLTHMGTTLDSLVPVREFVSELVGADASNAELIALRDLVHTKVASVRQAHREDVPVILQDTFDTAPDAEQWKAAHKVLGKTDMAALFDINNPTGSMKLLKDNALLSRKALQKEAVINSNFTPNVASIILEKAQQLAGFNTGQGAGHQLWKNAYAINKLAGEYNPAMTSEIDQLVSLYSLEASNREQKNMIADMYDADPEPIVNLMTYLQALNKEEDMKDISEIARMNGYKGFIPDEGSNNARLLIEKDSNRELLESRGFVRVGDFNAQVKFSSTRYGYYTSTVKQTGTYSQGVMQTVQPTYRGVDAVTGVTSNGTTAGTITGESVNTVTESLNDGLGVADPKDVMIPVYSGEEGTVSLYERAINPDLTEQYIDPKSNLALMLGSWAGRQVEEKLSTQYNRELIVELKRIYDERGSGDDSLFVDMRLEAKKLREYNQASKARQSQLKKPDPVFADSWAVIPQATKNAIEDIYGEDGGFMVRKDMVNLALGYRDPSIMDVWTGKTRIPENMKLAIKVATTMLPGAKGMAMLSRAEETTMGVISQAKDLIVIRSLVVPFMNSQANVFQLSGRGVGLKQMVKAYPDKLAEIEQYNINVKKLIELDIRVKLAGNDKNRVSIIGQQMQVIHDDNARMSVAPLIEAGAYKNISEGITDMDVELTSGRMGDWIENQLNRLPGGVQTVAKYGMLSKDTAIYKGANKAVQYGDFIAKAIYYDHLISKGESHDGAMKKVNEEFVNFSILPGRTRSYLESMGATWFFTFKIRITKIAMQMMRENPVRSLIVANTLPDIGSPIGDNLAAVTADGSVGYSIGWDMLLGSPDLNPWVNMSDG